MTYTRSSGSPPEPGFLVMSIEFQILFITYEKTITKKILKSKPLKLALRPLSFILLTLSAGRPCRCLPRW